VIKLPRLRLPSIQLAVPKVVHRFRQAVRTFHWPGLPARPRWLTGLKQPSVPGGLSLWITLLSLGFLMAALLGHGRAMLQLSLDPQGWLWLVLGLGICLLSLLANGLGLGVVLRWLGLRPLWAALVQLYLGSNLRKYLPGGIWHLSTRVQRLRSSEGVLQSPAPLGLALLGVLLDPLLAAAAALSLTVLAGWQGGLALVGILPLLLLWPRWLTPLLRRLEFRQARRLNLEAELDSTGGEALPPVLSRSLGGYPLLPLLAQMAFVLLRFGGFACCVLAFDLQATLDWQVWLAGFAAAWTAGLLVPGSPGGLGVFEAALLLRLGGAIPEAPLLAIALSYRLVVTLADLIGAALVQVDGWIDQRVEA
jgi:glycosyltransferase 2 family protein